MMGATCPGCGCGVALHAGRPVVTAVGAVELWHGVCLEAAEATVAPIVPAPSRQRDRRDRSTQRRWWPFAMSGLARSAVTLVGVWHHASAAPASDAAPAGIELRGEDEQLPIHAELTMRVEAPPPAPDPYPIPD